MPRKVVQGPIRDKERTKQKLLAAVGKILRTKGYLGLKVSKIAAVAGFDKKLIYEYFGGADKLIDEYIKSQDYWSKINQSHKDVDISNGGIELTKMVLVNQFENLKKNKEFWKIIIWELSESKPILKKLVEQREEVTEYLFKNFTDSYFGEDAARYRAIMALIVSGIYYLNLYTGYNASKFCGINLKTEEGRKEIEQAIFELIDYAYQKKNGD